MKLFPTILLLFFITLMVDVLSYEWDSDELECVEKLNIPKSVVEDNHPFQKTSPEDNTDLNKYYECMWKKSGYLHEDGTFDWDKMLDFFVELQQEDVEKNKSDSDETLVANLAITYVKGVINTCRNKHIHGDTHGETAVKVHNCLVEEFDKTKFED
ncbi:hypothetical protein ILUMI_10224 [Ignelater luminosus]|uniref:Uncharacterized protein n=1 Tax=Ignelater luminosus TaxID=2038154 RepID=A0A8K0D2H2_IGNLU|nr:hypothetical protein ILUMI_10224 [Ignelater luminosus]